MSEDGQQARARRPWRGRGGRLRRLGARLLAAGLVVVLVAAAGVAYLWASTDVPEPADVVTAQTSLLLYADGSELGRIGAVDRLDVDLDQVPEHTREAVLAAEDRGFWTQPGISPRGIARAAWSNVRGGEVLQGGSTITQQYAKNAYLTSERTFSRKMRELVLAVKIDRSRGKEQVLEDYLNTVYFGRGAYGVETAAQAWFGVGAADLDVGQSAVLASLVRAPSRYDPFGSPEAARGRFDYVLRGMVDEGWLTETERAAVDFPEVLPRADGDRLGGTTGYLMQQARVELEALGFDERRLTRSGYRVELSLDPRLQRLAEQTVTEVVGDGLVVEGDDGPQEVAVPLVAVEAATGRVLASVGGTDYVGRQLDAAAAEAPLGSAFKPVVLAAALDAGVGLGSVYDASSPRTFDGGYTVENYDGASPGRVDLRTATARSLNTAYVDLALDVGLEQVRRTGLALGLPADAYPPQAGASVALGVAEASATDLAGIYAGLAGQGLHADPHLVDRVLRADGTVVYTAPEPVRVLDEDVVADVTSALQGVVTDGTASGARLAGGRPAAGKTGTSQDNVSAWFAGYTPQLATATGLFSLGDRVPLRGVAGVGGQGVTGGSVPAELWKTFMDRALEGQEVLPFPPAAGVGRDAGLRTPTSPGASSSDDPSTGREPTTTPEVDASPSPAGEPSGSASPAPGDASPGRPGPTATRPGVTPPSPPGAPATGRPTPVDPPSPPGRPTRPDPVTPPSRAAVTTPTAPTR